MCVVSVFCECVGRMGALPWSVCWLLWQGLTDTREKQVRNSVLAVSNYKKNRQAGGQTEQGSAQSSLR